MEFKILVEDRKAIVTEMEAATGQKPKYTGMPRCAYTLKGIVVEKTGFVTTEEDADYELIAHLIGKGMIERMQGDDFPNIPVTAEETVEEETITEEAETQDAETVEETVAEDTVEDPMAEETTEETDVEDDSEEDEEPEAGVAEEELAETEDAASEEDAEETTYDESESVEPDEEEDEDYSQGAGDAHYDDVRSAADFYQSITSPDPSLVKPCISFSLERHTPDSICNLVFTAYARGGLISKATKGCFMASEELVEELKSGKILNKDDAIEIIREAGEDALKGISFEDGKVIFDGFPETGEPDEVRAWTALAAAINKACIKQKHVRPKKVDETNEKFAFRTWLTRLGMNGIDTKAERNILYRHLTGHTAFRTPADEEKWKAKQAEKRRELRASKEAASEENGAEE